MKSRVRVLAEIKYITQVLSFLLVIQCTLGDNNTLNAHQRCTRKGVANVAFVILSQDTSYHSTAAHELRESILSQARQTNEDVADINIIPENLNTPGSWTIVTLLPTLHQKYTNNKMINWVVFCDGFTYINLKELLNVLAKHNCSERKWIGYPIYDRRPTIIHHFASVNLPYPFIGSGFAMSMELIRSVCYVEKNSNFFIDAFYEIALAIHLKLKVNLTPEYRFCMKFGKNCVTAPKDRKFCNDIVPRNSIYFAVKTFRENHSTRAQILKDTWASQATNLIFFSDLHDTFLPAFDTGIRNTESGHCEKTIKIIQYLQNISSVNKKEKIKWIVLTDDDTILSVRRMEQVLGCFDNENGPVLLGERYGYGYGLGKTGYDYITGGGGIAMNAQAVTKLVMSCECPSSGTPDDMWLGACAKQNNIKIIHSEGFHQARPEDYSSAILSWMKPVSFHKLDFLEPYKIYYEWFKDNEESHQRNVRVLKHQECLNHRSGLNISRDEL